MPRWVAVFFVVACVLAGCDQEKLIAEVTPKEDLDYAKQYVALIRKSDFAAVEAAMAPSLKTPQLKPTLALMASMIPPEPPISIEVVGVQTARSEDGASSTDLTLQYQFPNSWLLVQIVIRRAAGAVIVDTIYFTPLQSSYKELNAFTLGGKPVLSYAILAWSIAVPIFIVASLIGCLVTPIPKRKWLWCIMVFVSVGSVGLNWTTGAIDFSLIWIGVLNLGFTQLGVDGPYYFESTIPIGAIVFWIKRRTWRHAPATEPVVRN